MLLTALWILSACEQDSPSSSVSIIDLKRQFPKHIDELSVLLKEQSTSLQDSFYGDYFQKLEELGAFDRLLNEYNILRQSNQRSLPNKIKITVASAYRNTGKLDTALILLQGMQLNLEQSGSAEEKGYLFRALAQCYEELKDLPTTVDYLFKALNAFSQANNLSLYNSCQIELATVYFFLKDYPKSVELHRKSYKYYESTGDTAQMAYILDGLTVALDNLDSLELSNKYAHQSLGMYRAIGDKRGMSVALNNLAHLYKRSGRLSEAEPFLREGLLLMREMEDRRYIPLCESNLGNCLLELQQLGEAEMFLLSAREGILQYSKEVRELANVELALAKLYEEQRQPMKALAHRIEYDRLKDSLNNKERMRILSEAATKYETKVREAEIERLRYTNEITKARQKIIILVAIVLVIFVGGWLRIRYERLNAVLQKEKEILAERGKTQDAELKLAKSELEMFAQKVQEKTRLLDELQIRFKSHPESFSNPEVTYLYIADLHNQKILTDEDWDLFKLQFDQVYPGFTSKLRMQFNDISQAELRLALLIKLKLETREIATTLGVSPDTVKKTRQRLRRRLGLTEEEKLEEVILQL